MSAMDLPADESAGAAARKEVARASAVTFISWVALALGELLVIQIYCPDELLQFLQMVENLKTAGVAG